MSGTDQRKEFGQKLKEVLGSTNVYFQPPPTAEMRFPCIVYERDNASRKAADNTTYSWRQRYQVTYISEQPDSDVIDKLMVYPLSSYSRHFATSELNHDVFVIYH